MRFDELRPAPGAHRNRRRVGRGYGSGRGTTAGRGSKGQKARSGGGVHPRFEGGQLPLSLRLPHKRGFTNIHRREYAVVNLAPLNRFAAGAEVTPETLKAAGLVKRGERWVKILGEGELAQPLVVAAHKFSASAREKIVAAGGTVRLLGATPEEPGKGGE